MEDPYTAYCVDEAVTYFGMRLEQMLDEASSGKASKEERKARARRDKVLDEVMGKTKNAKPQFADPALMFK